MSAESQARRPGARSRAIALAALAWFALSTLLLVSPIFFAIGNAIEPRILGLPFALVYVLGVVAINLAVLVGLYVTRTVDADDGMDTLDEHDG